MTTQSAEFLFGIDRKKYIFTSLEGNSKKTPDTIERRPPYRINILGDRFRKKHVKQGFMEVQMQQLIGKMAKMFPMLILMGFMIVVTALIIGYVNSQNAAAYFAETKLVRETTLLAERASLESTGLWLPYFKFLGLGLILGGIVMALRVIIDNLKAAGEQVLANIPEGARPSPPKPPAYAPMMPMVMMSGWVIFIVALIVALGLAADARALFSNPLPEIDAAGSGTFLLGQLETIVSTSAWLVPLKFLGIATQFLAIVMGLSTIVYILTSQTELIQKGIQIARSSGDAGKRDEKENTKVTA